MKKLLIVSPHFPPVNAPDCQRVRMSLSHYRRLGWEPIVLTVATARQHASMEPALLATFPADVRVVHCDALPLRWTRLFGLGNLGLRAWFYLLRAGEEIIRSERVDLVFFSSAQFITFPLGRVWREKLSVPYVIDLHDPWRTDYYERPGVRKPPGGWKYQFARIQAWLLEEWTLRKAGGVISVSENYLDDLRERYRWFRHTPNRVIRFGASTEDLSSALAQPFSTTTLAHRDGIMRVVYTGAAGPIMPHALTVLFDGFRRFREIAPEAASKLRFYFIGTSYAAPGEGVNSVIPVAESCGVADQVEEFPHRIGHLECIRIQAEADVLLILGSSDLAYSPSKLYPCYLARRPMLALVFEESTLEKLLVQLNCARVIRFSEKKPKGSAHDSLIRFFKDAVAGFPSGTLPEPNDTFFNAHYLASTLTERQCELFSVAAEQQAGQSII